MLLKREEREEISFFQLISDRNWNKVLRNDTKNNKIHFANKTNTNTMISAMILCNKIGVNGFYKNDKYP